MLGSMLRAVQRAASHRATVLGRPMMSSTVPLGSAIGFSFIAKAKQAEDVECLKGPFPHEDRFDSCLKNMTIDEIAAGSGLVRCSVTVGTELANSFGTMHGGAISTLVDVAGTRE
jgi:hypothetical protein